MIHIRLSVWRVLPAMLALFVLASPVSLQAITVKGPVFTDFTFSGLCTDCSGSATATLRLQDYFQGDPIIWCRFTTTERTCSLRSPSRKAMPDSVSGA
jgi:hypothetical protein